MKKLLLLILFTFGIHQTSQAQVLISLIFGDKLNSDKLEFGLLGGVNLSNMSELSGAETLPGFHLGFYFDLVLNDKLLLHPGVIVKSPLGTQGLAPYPTGDDNLDELFETNNGEVARKLRYFHVPVLLKYRFLDQLYAEGGVQLGLMYKAFDEFTASVEDDDDLVYTVDIKDQIKRIEAGVALGAGYKLLKGQGMQFGVRYFWGLTDTLKDNPGDAVKNSSLYIYATIPVGKGKAKARREAEKNKDKKIN